MIKTVKRSRTNLIAYNAIMASSISKDYARVLTLYVKPMMLPLVIALAVTKDMFLITFNALFQGFKP